MYLEYWDNLGKIIKNIEERKEIFKVHLSTYARHLPKALKKKITEGNFNHSLLYSLGCEEINIDPYNKLHLNNALALEMRYLYILDEINEEDKDILYHYSSLFLYNEGYIDYLKEVRKERKLIESEHLKEIRDDKKELFDKLLLYDELISKEKAELFGIALSLPPDLHEMIEKTLSMRYLGKLIGSAYHIIKDIKEVLEPLPQNVFYDKNNAKLYNKTSDVLRMIIKREGEETLKVLKRIVVERYLSESYELKEELEKEDVKVYIHHFLANLYNDINNIHVKEVFVN